MDTTTRTIPALPARLRTIAGLIEDLPEEHRDRVIATFWPSGNVTLQVMSWPQDRATVMRAVQDITAHLDAHSAPEQNRDSYGRDGLTYRGLTVDVTSHLPARA